MTSFLVIGFLFITIVNANSQIDEDHVTEFSTDDEVMDFSTGEYSDGVCAIKGNNSMCTEDINEQIQGRLENMLGFTGNELVGEKYVEVISRNFIARNDYCELCLHTSRFHYQPTVLNIKDQKLYVVQTTKINQRFDVQICVSELLQQESACIKDKVNTSQETSCKQKYSEVSVLLFNAENDSLMQKTIKYPASCVCVIEE